MWQQQRWEELASLMEETRLPPPTRPTTSTSEKTSATLSSHPSRRRRPPTRPPLSPRPSPRTRAASREPPRPSLATRAFFHRASSKSPGKLRAAAGAVDGPFGRRTNQRGHTAGTVDGGHQNHPRIARVSAGSSTRAASSAAVAVAVVVFAAAARPRPIRDLQSPPLQAPGKNQTRRFCNTGIHGNVRNARRSASVPAIDLVRVSAAMGHPEMLQSMSGPLAPLPAEDPDQDAGPREDGNLLPSILRDFRPTKAKPSYRRKSSSSSASKGVSRRDGGGERGRHSMSGGGVGGGGSSVTSGLFGTYASDAELGATSASALDAIASTSRRSGSNHDHIV